MPSHSSSQGRSRQSAHATPLYEGSQPVLYPQSYGRYPDLGSGESYADGGNRGSGSGSGSGSDEFCTPELWSPQTGFRYRVDGLQNPETETVVRDVLSQSDPVDMHFSQCRLHERVYAFEIKETVTRTVRIGPPGSRYFKPRCEACSGSSSSTSNPYAGDRDSGNTSVCRHVVWVLDHLARQGLSGAVHPDAALTMGPDGHAVEMGSPYDLCRAMPLDQLASRLHCRVAPPAGQATDTVDIRRVAEIKRMLSAVSGPDRWDHYDERMLGAGARDDGENPVQRGDLDGTLFRMLYANPAFFTYFRSQLDPQDGRGDGMDLDTQEYQGRRNHRERQQSRERQRSRRRQRSQQRRQNHHSGYDTYGRQDRQDRHSRHDRHDSYQRSSSRHHRRPTTSYTTLVNGTASSSRGAYYDYEMRTD